MRQARDTPLAHTKVILDMSQPALTRTTMAHEGSLTGTANNGPHEVHPDPSKGKVDAAHQHAETSVILEGLEQMSKNSGLHRQKYITPPTISFVWILFGLLHRDPK